MSRRGGASAATEWARKRQEAIEKAKRLKEERKRGKVGDEHTFKPSTGRGPMSRTPSSGSFDDGPDTLDHHAARVSAPQPGIRVHASHHDPPRVGAVHSPGSDSLTYEVRKYGVDEPPAPSAAAVEADNTFLGMLRGGDSDPRDSGPGWNSDFDTASSGGGFGAPPPLPGRTSPKRAVRRTNTTASPREPPRYGRRSPNPESSERGGGTAAAGPPRGSLSLLKKRIRSGSGRIRRADSRSSMGPSPTQSHPEWDSSGPDPYESAERGEAGPEPSSFNPSRYIGGSGSRHSGASSASSGRGPSPRTSDASERRRGGPSPRVTAASRAAGPRSGGRRTTGRAPAPHSEKSGYGKPPRGGSAHTPRDDPPSSKTYDDDDRPIAPARSKPGASVAPIGGECTRQSGCRCYDCAAASGALSAPAPGPSGGECTRQSGCRCKDCYAAESTLTKPAAFAEAPVAPSVPLFKCRDCGRSFSAEALSKHEPRCKKVFQTKRKAFNARSGHEGEKFAREAGIDLASGGGGGGRGRRIGARGGGRGSRGRGRGAVRGGGVARGGGGRTRGMDRPIPGGGGKKEKWKARSSAFRDAMRAARMYNKAVKEGKDVRDLPMPKSEPDPSLVPCPHCGRTYNESAAERHIPKCATMIHKPKRLVRGGGGTMGAGRRKR